MTSKIFKASFFVAILFIQQALDADQPVMNEVPRWNNGYGFQVFQEFRWSNKLMSVGTAIDNPNHLDYRKKMTHLEGVYTWHKGFRATIKIPWVEQERKTLDATGQVVSQKSKGFKDIKLAFPIKKYTNKRKYSGHIGVVPQIRFAGNSSGPYPIRDGSTDFGISCSFERETANFKFGGDFTYWFEENKNDGDDWQLDMVLGWNFNDSGALHLESGISKEVEKGKWFASFLEFQ